MNYVFRQSFLLTLVDALNYFLNILSVIFGVIRSGDDLLDKIIGCSISFDS